MTLYNIKNPGFISGIFCVFLPSDQRPCLFGLEFIMLLESFYCKQNWPCCFFRCGINENPRDGYAGSVFLIWIPVPVIRFECFLHKLTVQVLVLNTHLGILLEYTDYHILWFELIWYLKYIS